MKRLAEIMARLKEIEVEVRDATGDKLKEFEAEADRLLEEKRQIEKHQSELARKFEEGRKVVVNEEEVKVEEEETDPFGTMAYRKAFRDYVTRKVNRIDPKIYKRLDAVTLTTDVGEVIPTTILNKVVQELKDYGEILAKVSYTNYKGGVKIPVAGAKPTAAWVTEGSVAAKQKQEIDDAIVFGYLKLQVRVAASLIAATTTLDLWEQTVAQNVAEAMAVKLEDAIINGNGTTEPLGIVNDDEIPEANVIDFAAADATWNGWKTKFFSGIPLAYRKKRNGVILVNPLTWDKYMDGMKDDTTGQPIARVDHGIVEGPVYRFFGKQVILTELVPDFDTASAEDIFLIYVDLKDYLINSNLQITTRVYFDENTDEWIHKSTLICDGKLADRYGVVLLAKSTGGE